jgi:DNA-binding LacI/PurR family transcriptional regulator
VATPTSRDVAKLAGVSQSTVSYVLSGKRPISPETRKRVEGAIAELTFQPNAGARALASQRTQVIGLVAPFGVTSDHSGLLPFIETIARSVREHDHDLLLVTNDEGADGLVRVAGRRIVDALVVMEVEARDERIPVAAGLDVPVVLIGVPDDRAGLPCVDVDFHTAGALAVAELAESGCRSAAVLGYSSAEIDRGINYVTRFLDGVRSEATRRGLPLVEVSPVELDRASVDAALDEVLSVEDDEDGELPGLVLPHTEGVAGVLRALADRGLVPGEHLAVVAMSTDAAAEEFTTPLTNVSLEPRDVSRRAVEALFRLLDPDPDVPGAADSGVELVQPRLTRRASTPARQQARSRPHPAVSQLTA